MAKLELPAIASFLALVVVGCNGSQPAPTAPGGDASRSRHPEAPSGAHAAVPDAFPRFVAQEGWSQEAVTSSMRLHQFRLPGADGHADVEVVVASWPNGVGPREDNLVRWASQVGATAVDPAKRWEQDVRQFKVTTVELQGPYTPDGGNTQADGTVLLASWIEVPGEARVWTVKATGPAASIAKWRASYDAFMAGL
jgi:hypothetical protein